MKPFLLILFFSIPVIAQHFQLNDPYPSSNITAEVNFQVEKYFPVFGTSEKPYTSERILRINDLDGEFIAYLYFVNKYLPPKLEAKEKILRFYYPEEYYDYILHKLDKDVAYIVYREYKDGHKWGEIYFDKYP